MQYDDDRRAPGRPVDKTLDLSILEAALVELAEGGYARFTTANVARRAGVSTATLYRRWPAKRDLLLAVGAQIAAYETDEFDTGSLAADVRAFIRAKRNVLRSPMGATSLALIGESAHDTELAAVLRDALYKPAAEMLETMFARAKRRGESSSALSPAAAAGLIIGQLFADIAFNINDDGVESALVRAITGESTEDI